MYNVVLLEVHVSAQTNSNVTCHVCGCGSVLYSLLVRVWAIDVWGELVPSNISFGVLLLCM